MKLRLLNGTHSFLAYLGYLGVVKLSLILCSCRLPSGRAVADAD